MIFEVDNTTEKIIERLQASIEGSIQGIHKDQNAITKELNSLKGEFSQDEVLDSLRDVRKEMDDISDKLQGIERGNEDTLASLDKISSSLAKLNDDLDNGEEFAKILELLSNLAERINESHLEIQSLKETNNKISGSIDIVSTSINDANGKIVNILKNEDGINRKIDSLSQTENETREQITEIKEQIKGVDSKINIANDKGEVLDGKAESIISGVKSNEDKLVQLQESAGANGNKIDNIIGASEENARNVLSVQDTVSANGQKLDVLTTNAEEAARSDALQKEQLDRITAYLKKPGIARFFAGMKGE